MSSTDYEALMPDAEDLSVFTEEIAEQEDEQTKAQLQLEQETVSIQNSPAWQRFITRIDEYIELFRTGAFIAGDIHKMDKAEVGEKYIVASTIAGICEELKSIMTNANQVVAEDAKRKQQQQQAEQESAQ